MQAVEDVARGLVEAAAEAADAASREAAAWKERAQQQTNKIAQTEQKVEKGGLGGWVRAAADQQDRADRAKGGERR